MTGDDGQDDLAPRVFSVGPAASGSVDRVLSLVGYPHFFVDVRSAPLVGPVRAWLRSTLPMRSIGFGLCPGLEELQYEDSVLEDAFDVLVFLDHASESAESQFR
ncbi:MAG: erythromycin esterase family protein [Polyangiaceae bacterium]|nr:erythromycin esterase family protein [Polyangiaceae bacterium]